MKIITSLLLLTFLGINTVLFAQECGTPSDTQNQDFSSLRKKRVGVNTTFTINVYFHIVRNSSGTGGFNPSNIDLIVNNLNSVYNPYNIFINKLGVDFINNSTYYDLSGSEFGSLIGINNVSNAINFYLVNNYGSYAGEAEDILSKNLVVVNSYALTPTSQHEIGHCLNLYHTHHGLGCNDTGGCRESIISSRPNCEDCGDFVCDTPADPCVLGKVNSNCEYTGGGGYNPDLTNIMSYGSSCRTNFTQGQADRIRRALASSSLLQGVVAVPELVGASAICNDYTQTFTLQNVPNFVTATWQVSPDLQIINFSNSFVNVRPISSSVNGQGFIKAILSNQTLTKQVTVNNQIYNNLQEISVSSINHTMPLSIGSCNDIGIKLNFYPQKEYSQRVQWEKITNNFQWCRDMGNYDDEYAIISPYRTGDIRFKVRVENSCGWSDRQEITYRVASCNNFNVYPNPASISLTIQRSEPQAISLSDFDTSSYNQEHTYRLYDFNQNIVSEGTIRDLSVIYVFNLTSGYFKNNNFRRKL